MRGALPLRVGVDFLHSRGHASDLAVIEPASRSLVLRAGGTSSLGGNTTAVEAGKHAVAQRARGFELATGSLVENFRRELADFDPACARARHR